jgi:hypothetical protein
MAANSFSDHVIRKNLGCDDLAVIIGEMISARDGVKLHTTGGNIHEIPSQGYEHFDE